MRVYNGKIADEPVSNVGKDAVWRARLPGHYVLKMDRGDPTNCPFGTFRHSVVSETNLLDKDHGF